MKRLAAALFACQVGAALAGDTIGRLFFTPEQRAQLDAVRKQPAQRPVIEAPPEEAPPAATVTYSGLVSRSDGHSTVWINDRPVHDPARGGQQLRARVAPDGAASITLPQQQRTVRLKVGQSAELASGRIAESYTRAAPRAPAVEMPRTTAESKLRLRRRYEYDRDLPPDGNTP